ncbi:MAG: hydrogenase nickel incorporation protein HypB [Candidatus Bathyarchaeota archaeon]|nr:MAG: hydrogenase nickel incorporation protein HypB [Candidatus Bathyarchaeota archaeon]
MVRLKEVVEAEEGEVYDIELEADLLEANRRLAEKNRELLQRYDVKAIDIMGAIGSGKTSLIEKMVQALTGKYRIAAFKGDLTTTIDAERIERHGAKTVTITTGKECHLDANLVGKALQRLDLKEIDLLLIENVGNLICPAEFPLGADQRAVVVSVTEGPYMVIKHPFIFIDADVVAINKMDLADAMGVDMKKLASDVKRTNPKAKVALTNCRSGEGVKEVIDALQL